MANPVYLRDNFCPLAACGKNIACEVKGLNFFEKERKSYFLCRSFKKSDKELSLFCSLQKEQQRAMHSFALYQKNDKEQFALTLFTKRATKSKSLCRSLQKEQQRANRSFALYKKSKRAPEEQIAPFYFFPLYI